MQKKHVHGTSWTGFPLFDYNFNAQTYGIKKMIREIIDACCYYDAFSLFPVSWSREGRTDSPPQTTKYRHSSNVIRGRKERGASAWEEKGHGTYYVFVAREMRNSRQGKEGGIPSVEQT